MTELVLSCPRFTRNLTGQRATLILCLPQIPTLAVHWSAIELGDTGRHCLTLRITHWAKPSRGQAGQLLDNQFIPFKLGEQFIRHSYFWLIYLSRRLQESFISFPPYFPNVSLRFIRMFNPFIQINV